MSFYQLWGRWNPLDECFAWIRDKVPPGRSAGESKGPPAVGEAGAGEPEEEASAAQPTVYRRISKSAKPRAGRAFNPVIGRPIKLPDLASNAHKDDITKVLQTLQLIRARSGGATAECRQEHLTYGQYAD